MTRLSPTASRLRKKYVRVANVGDAWNTYLQIDQQGFCIVRETDKKRAEWYGRMLAIALERMIQADGDVAVSKQQ